jgi:hydrogenase nickel incorporation protein HypB
MCTVCGCGATAAMNSADVHHHNDHGHSDADHRHDDPAGGSETPLGAVHAPGMAPSWVIQVEKDILAENNRFAADNRKFFEARRILGLNLMSSPGSGKTTLLVRTIQDLQPRIPVAVIEGDQQTSFDAERIRAAGAPTIQINTGRNCHLDAHMVGHALKRLELKPGAVVFIENVGNLVCPAAFDLGEASKVVMLSVTEGDDKPLKYPDIFAASDLMVLTKMDLLPYVNFDVSRCIALARRIQPTISVVQLSATVGEGLDAWYQWIARCREARQEAVEASAR